MLNSNEQLMLLALKNKGNWEKIFANISKEEFVSEEEAEMLKTGDLSDFITILDKEYPETLKNSFRPPFTLFYKGNINLLKDKNLSRLGIGSSRTLNSYDRENISLILGDTDYLCVVNGESAVSDYLITHKDKPVIVVLDRPLSKYSFTDYVVKNGGLVITEIPETKTEPDKDQGANLRIISGLVRKTLILSCERNTMTLFQIQTALETGNELFVVPCSPQYTDLVNNQFISEGAIPVWNKETLKFAYDS